MSVFTIFTIFLRLGLTSFGGPVAHLGYFRTEFVENRGWFSEEDYADLVALCQFLPGPASSQVGFAIGYNKGGYLGAFAAFLGFTLPSMAIMMAFGYGIVSTEGQIDAGLLQGLKIVAVAIVAQAVWGMAKGLCTDGVTRTIAILSALFLLVSGLYYAQFIVLVFSGILSFLIYTRPNEEKDGGLKFPQPSSRKGFFFIGVFFFLLVGLPFVTQFKGSDLIQQFDSFFRSGALVFGGGHVVLPLLQYETVDSGWISKDVFLAGYGLAQAIPGPLFTFATYLGTVTGMGLSGWQGALFASVAIFLPGFLLVLGFLPYWDRLRVNPAVRHALKGVNASVVGLLLAALVTPVATTGLLTVLHAIMALIALALLTQFKLSPWIVVLGTALTGYLFL
ncbi:chromate efflux transporter [Temperatibacter marinus]|uniref:Chromate efflux transporter n=1 Tax=Temperatibacter marinus TaxID=1456591 RepID=A0AA52EES8_9PROT|nr:chromate efflux transporter [Temperatibacter marinus]WND01758.1 chromate efflux transporter [Temperatibacter marinus]